MTTLTLAVAVLLGLVAPAAAPALSQKKPQAAVLTGCLDQSESDYVLRDERTLEQTALLEAVGFPKEGFAKYVGRKVRVTGTKVSADRGTTLRVRRVDVISQTCTPDQEPQAPK